MAFLLNGQTFAALGISSAALTRSASGDDSLVITVPRLLSTAAGFAAFQQVTLTGTGEDSGANFIGWLDQAPRRAAGNRHAWTYVFTGPMRWLERSIYQQPFLFLAQDPEGLQIVADAGTTGFATLGREINTETGTQGHQSLGSAIAEVLDYAIDDVGGFTYTLVSGLSAEIPWEPRQDDQAKNALRALLKWSPELVCRWDGTELQIARPSGTAKPLTTASLAVRDVTLNPRYDLVCASAAITYLRRIPDEVGADRYAREIDSNSGGEIAGGRAVKLTVFLEEGEDFLSPGIAQEFMRWAGKLHIDGRFVLRGLNWSNLPGDKWSPISALGGLQAYNAVCQTITRDLFTRTETIGIGVPGHLGLLDLIALKRKPRRPDPGEPSGAETEVTGTITITITGLPDGVTGKWSVSDQAGEGDSVVTLPAGDYTVEFFAAFDVEGGAIYFAEDVVVAVVANADVPADGEYAPVVVGGNNPWKVELRNAGTVESPNWQWRVIAESLLMENAIPDNLFTVSGLNTWASFSDDLHTWVKVTFNSGAEVTAAQIEESGSATFDLDADPWTANSIVEDDAGTPPEHLTSRKLIAKVLWNAGAPTVDQRITTNQILSDTCMYGRPCRYFR